MKKRQKKAKNKADRGNRLKNPDGNPEGNPDDKDQGASTEDQVAEPVVAPSPTTPASAQKPKKGAMKKQAESKTSRAAATKQKQSIAVRPELE